VCSNRYTGNVLLAPPSPWPCSCSRPTSHSTLTAARGARIVVLHPDCIIVVAAIPISGRARTTFKCPFSS
jgi:hypothetical protein